MNFFSELKASLLQLFVIVTAMRYKKCKHYL